MVDVHGERDAGVAEAFAVDFGVDALLQQDRGVGVTQAVQANAGQVEYGEEALEGLGDEVGVDGRSRWGLAKT